MRIKKLILGLILILSIFTVMGCSKTTTNAEIGLDYTEFDSITDYNQIFNRREGTYLVYIYQTTCAACLRLKPDFLAFANTYEDYNVYFFNVSNVSETSDSSSYLAAVGQTKVQTPVLLVIKNNTFDSTNVSRYFYSGETKIRAIMMDFQNGAFPYWK